MTVELGGGEKEVSRCINCDAVGSLTCTTCQGSGIQPRYLDRRYEILQPVGTIYIQLFLSAFGKIRVLTQ